MHIFWKPRRHAAVISASLQPGCFWFAWRSRWNLRGAPVCHLQPSISCLMAISPRKIAPLLKRGIGCDTITSPFWNIPISHCRPWNSLITAASPLPPAAGRPAPPLAPLSSTVQPLLLVFFYIKFIDLNKKLFTSSIYHIVLYCLSSTVSSVRKPLVYCFIDLLWTKGCLLSDLLKNKRRESCRVVPAPYAACFARFIAQELLNSPPAI